MRKTKEIQNICIVLTALLSTVTSNATRVLIGDIYYSLSGDEAFVSNGVKGAGECYDKESYTIPPTVNYDGYMYTVREIETSAFDGSALSYVCLPNTLTAIRHSAFRNCKNLKRIIIPKEVDTISKSISGGSSANSFEGCSTLRQIIYTSVTPPVGWVASANTYVPSINNYKEPAYSINNPRIKELITWSNNEFTYSGISPELPEFICNLPEYDVSFEKPVLSKEVGNYSIILETTFYNESESFIAQIPYVYTIKPTTVTVNVLDMSREYGEQNPEFILSYDGFVLGDNECVLEKEAFVSTPANDKSDVGIYPICLSGAIARNYTFEYIDGQLRIDPAPLFAEIDSVKREYGQSNPMFSLRYQGLKNGEKEPAWIEYPVFNTMANVSSSVGDYEITATAIPINYNLAPIPAGVLQVLPAKLKVEAVSKSRMYYEDNPELTFRYIGFKNGETETIVYDTPVLTTDAKLESNVGKFDIIVSGGSAPNYEMEYQQGILTINPRVLSVYAGRYERVYGETNPVFELEYDGFVNFEDSSILTKIPVAYTDATQTSNVGVYPIYITKGDAMNYTFNYNKGQLNIVKTDQEIIWNQDFFNHSVGQQVELLAYSTSGLPVIYNLDSNNVGEIYSVGNKQYLDCTGEGEILIKASQNGNDNYNASPRVSKKIVVNSSSFETPILTIKQLPVGSITTAVDWGSIHSFTVSPEYGWKTNTISINGIDCTNNIDNNGIFTTPPITQNSTIIISYIDINAEIHAISMPQVKIIGSNNGIKIEGANKNSDIVIYSIEGYILKTWKTNDDEFFIPLPPDNTYIVKIDGITSKIRI